MRTLTLREMGITQNTRIRYEKMIDRFLDFVKLFRIAWPRTPAQLDWAAGEFLEHLWEDDRPEYWAAGFVSALKRFLPIMRKLLPVTSMLLSNWRRSLVRWQALPLTPLLVKAFAGLAFYHGKDDFGIGYPIGLRVLLACRGAP